MWPMWPISLVYTLNPCSNGDILVFSSIPAEATNAKSRQTCLAELHKGHYSWYSTQPRGTTQTQQKATTR